MAIYKSEFDRPIDLYHTLLRFIQQNGSKPSYRELYKASGYSGNGYFANDMVLLLQWGWIEDTWSAGKGVTPCRPTENIFLVPRPIQEDFSC